jgi:tRNA (guanine-N7-)-methyltransferase
MANRRHEEDLRSYGRRRARAPSARQKALWEDVLPRVAVPSDPERLARLQDLFPQPVRDTWLEIGFGGGEHLVWQARRHPDVGFIGCEPFEDGVVKLLSAIVLEDLSNVRVYAADARPLLRLLPEASIGRVFILFPDPWPKKRHHKRRLVSPGTLSDLARVMRPGAELRLATDVSEYASVMLRAALANRALVWTAGGPDDWRRRTSDWPETRYERKAAGEGRRCYYFRFQRVTGGSPSASVVDAERPRWERGD